MSAGEYWTAIKLFHRGDDFFGEMLSRIRAAMRSITVETYIFEFDELGREIFDELAGARKRGCDVKLLVDGVGSFNSIGVLESACAGAEVSFRVFSSPFSSFFLRYIFKLGRFVKWINRRNHRKITVIDGEAAFVGSFNIAKVHSERHMGPAAWRDSGALLQGPPVTELARAFSAPWDRAEPAKLRLAFRRRKDHAFASQFIRLNAASSQRRFLYQDLVRRLNKCKERIRIATAYFLPGRGILRALKKAAARGVKVEILIPGDSDIPMVKWAAYEVVRLLVKAGVSMFEYKPSIFHAKFMLIDGWATIGSLNMNHRSFIHDLEVEAVLTDEESIRNLDAQWSLDKGRARALDERFYKEASRSLLVRLLSRLAFMIRYFL